MIKEIMVEEIEKNRLDYYISTKTELSRMTVQRLVEEQKIKVNRTFSKGLL